MCGIVGRLGWDIAELDPERRSAAVSAVCHRGPDDRGQTTVDGVWLGHTRLSILDLTSKGHQPLTDRSGRWTLTYNGEVYNYVELRRELASRGHRFTSTGDTEVVLTALVEWGAAALSRFNGMWALALVDRQRREVLLSRDRFGVKPLFTAQLADGSPAFASEPKALLALDPGLSEPDDVRCALFLAHDAAADPTASFHRGIETVPPATARVVSSDGSVRDSTYWRPPDPRAEGAGEDVVEEFRDLLTDAVRVRLRSDVPLATTLSGGVDSTVVTTLAAERADGRTRAFTADFGGSSSDESDAAVRTATRLGVPVVRVPVDVRRLDLELLGDIVRHLDGPTGSPAVVPTWHVMRAVRAHGTKVVLEGQGADELLGGYPTHVLPPSAIAAVHAHDPREAWASVRGLHRHAGLTKSLALLVHASSPQLARLGERTRPSALAVRRGRHSTPSARAGAPRAGDVQDRLRWDHRHVLPPLLDYGDRMSMAHGVEVRLPFLDYRVVDLVMSLPPTWKASGGRGKVLLRQAFSDLLPESVQAGPKRGYPTPVAAWLDALGPELADLLRDGELVQRGYVSRTGLEALLLLHHGGRAGLPLFRMLTAELWLRSLKVR